MRAAVYERYGGPEAIVIREVQAPVPRVGEALVRVRAASVNSWDWDKLSGNLLGRLGAPFRPSHRILGADIAGTVEAVGSGVSHVSVGDDVVAELSEAGWGGFAEFVSVSAAMLVQKPASLGFEQAAAVPQAGTLALQALRKRRPLRQGDGVLIVGGGGGVGTFAIQLAKRSGAEVTAVDRGSKLALMQSLGADQVMDYERDDFTTAGRRYDRIVDMVARHPLAAYRRSLTPDGTLAVVGGRIGALLQLGLIGPLASKPEGQDIGLLIWQSRPEDIAEMLGLCATGAVTPAVEKVFSLDGTAEALRRIGEGSILGKAVIATPG